MIHPQPEIEAIAEGLSERYWERLRVFGARRLGDAALAEDLAQETLRRVTEALRNGRVERLDAIPAFVFQTATHICLHHYRSRGREERALAQFSGSAPGAPAQGPLDALLSEEDRAAVRTAMGRLASDDRELLRRIYFEEEPFDVMAGRLGVTAGALRVRKHRALERLGRLLGPWRT